MKIKTYKGRLIIRIGEHGYICAGVDTNEIGLCASALLNRDKKTFDINIIVGCLYLLIGAEWRKGNE